MKPTRNHCGRYCNPQPALFLGLKDNPDQTILFDVTDPDPEPAREWTTVFDDEIPQPSGSPDFTPDDEERGLHGGLCPVCDARTGGLFCGPECARRFRAMEAATP